MNVREYIIRKFSATPGLENYDLSVGTNIYDLIIRPLGTIFEDALARSDVFTAAEMRAWASMPDLPMGELKNLAMVKGIEPAAKTESSTNITLYFSAPVDWVIPLDTTLSSASYTFYTREEIRITAAVLEANQDSVTKLYYYSNVYVYNITGDNVDANTLGYIADAPPELVKITHPAVTNGILDDTRASLVNKIKKRELAITGTNANSLIALANLYYPGMDAFVVTPGHALMQRDIVYNIAPGITSPVLETGFAGKIRRNNQYVNNQAYLASIPEAEIGFSYVPDELDEFTQGQYLAVVEGADSSVLFSTDNVLNETFTQSSEKIGNSSPLLAMPSTPTRYLYVEETDYFASGDGVNITDRTSDQPTQNGIIEEIASYTDAGASYDGLGDITLTGTDLDEILQDGCKILITDDNGDEYAGYFASLNAGVISLIEAPDGLAAGIVDLEVKRIVLYSNLNVAITVFTNMSVDVVNAEGLYIGPGWIKSEHNLPIGIFINENEACVIDGELVLGARFNGNQVNAVKQMFLRYGIGNMMNAMRTHIGVRVVGLPQELTSGTIIAPPITT